MVAPKKKRMSAADRVLSRSTARREKVQRAAQESGFSPRTAKPKAPKKPMAKKPATRKPASPPKRSAPSGQGFGDKFVQGIANLFRSPPSRKRGR